jgi:shikimate kinase / 3-dehydroquinate synthase
LLDIDALIEQEYGERIATIFARHGEEYFRSLESRVLAQATQEAESAVIVTGGGIVVRPENRAAMAERGVRIFLQVEPHVALQRLLKQYETEQSQGCIPELRPLLAGPDPLATLQSLLNARSAWYNEAELACSTQEKSAEQVAAEIASELMDKCHELKPEEPWGDPAGAWSDLPDTLLEDLDQLRHASSPTSPLDEL